MYQVIVLEFLWLVTITKRDTNLTEDIEKELTKHSHHLCRIIHWFYNVSKQELDFRHTMYTVTCLDD